MRWNFVKNGLCVPGYLGISLKSPAVGNVMHEHIKHDRTFIRLQMRVQWLLAVILTFFDFGGSSPNVWDFGHTLQGDVMQPITGCPKFSVDELQPGSIHIVISLTANMQEYYRSYAETVQYYAAMHGYHFRLVDPSALLNKFGGDFKPFFSSMTAGKAVLSLKSLISLYYMHEIFQEFGCKARWLLVLDSDIMIANFARRLESIIGFAENMLGGGGSSALNENAEQGCHIISQQGPATNNGGVLFFNISPQGRQVLVDWVSTTLQHLRSGIEWQEDQGRLQQTYLAYLSKDLHIDMPLDCALPVKDPIYRKMNPSRMSANALRNLCFARNLYLTGLLPQLRSTGRYCMLPPMNDVSTFNLHDMEKTETIENDEYVVKINFYDSRGQLIEPDPIQPVCRIHNPFLLHNKDVALGKALLASFHKLQVIMDHHNLTSNFPLNSTTDLPFHRRILGFNAHRPPSHSHHHHTHNHTMPHSSQQHHFTPDAGVLLKSSNGSLPQISVPVSVPVRLNSQHVQDFWGRVQPVSACGEQVLRKLQHFGEDPRRIPWMDPAKEAKFSQHDPYKGNVTTNDPSSK